MDYSVKQIFVPSSTLKTTGDTTALSNYQMGFYDPSTYTALSSASGVTELLAAFGSGNTKFGSFKTSKIKQENILSFTGYAPDTTAQQQISYIGFDEVEDSKSPTMHCDEEYFITIRIWENYSAGVYQPLIQDSVRIKTTCCDDCSGNCDALDCKTYFEKAVADINANPLLSKYVTASLVDKCTGSAATTVFALTLPDPGAAAGGITDVMLDTTAATGFTNGSYTAITMTSTSGSGTGATYNFTVAGEILTTVTINAAGSGYKVGDTVSFAGTEITGGTTPADDFTITVTATDSAEGLLLSAVRSFYSALVDDAETDIVFSSDTDSSEGDANSTGNIRIEITPSAGVVLADLEAFEGIFPEEVTLTASTEACGCGIKLVGNALDEFGNTCVPEAVPYIANLVRFHVYVHPGPNTTQDFDLEDFCSPWAITTTQEIKFPVGAGVAMAELERHYFRNNLANVYERGYYMSPIYNNDTTSLLVDTSKTYFQYFLSWLDPAPVGFEKRGKDVHSLMILVDSTNTTLANSLESFLSTFTGITVNVA